MGDERIDPDLWLTTGQVSRATSIPQQTLIAWDRAGTLKAKSRPGVRSSPRAARRYDEHGVAAAYFARELSGMGLAGRDSPFREMVQAFQSGDPNVLKRAGILTYRSFPGLMKHVYSADLSSADDQRYVAHLRKIGALVEEPTDLWTTREPILALARKVMTNPGLRDVGGILREEH